MNETTEQATSETGTETRSTTTTESFMQVRASDLEPYTGLRYLSKLFRIMAVILVLLLLAEIITGLVRVGQAAIPTLLAESSRLIVLAGLLWGAGDLAILFIDMGHDIRASRILQARQAAHHISEHHVAVPVVPERTRKRPRGDRAVDRRPGEEPRAS